MPSCNVSWGTSCAYTPLCIHVQVYLKCGTSVFWAAESREGRPAPFSSLMGLNSPYSLCPRQIKWTAANMKVQMIFFTLQIYINF